MCLWLTSYSQIPSATWGQLSGLSVIILWLHLATSRYSRWTAWEAGENKTLLRAWIVVRWRPAHKRQVPVIESFVLWKRYHMKMSPSHFRGSHIVSWKLVARFYEELRERFIIVSEWLISSLRRNSLCLMQWKKKRKEKRKAFPFPHWFREMKGRWRKWKQMHKELEYIFHVHQKSKTG